jgi:hypothetical protein
MSLSRRGLLALAAGSALCAVGPALDIGAIQAPIVALDSALVSVMKLGKGTPYAGAGIARSA